MRNLSLKSHLKTTSTPGSPSDQLISRVYQKWPGNNIFFCGGRCVTGPKSDCRSRLVLQLFIIAVSIAFYITEFSGLWNINKFLIILPIVLEVIFYISLIRASLMDPGILPRGENASANPTNQFTKKSTIDGEEVVLRWCYTCLIWRQPRTSHCPICNNCVVEYDHHCHVLGTCIGARNYKYFLLTLGSGYLLLFVVVVDTGILYIVDTSDQQQSAIIAASFALVLGGIICLGLTFFCCFHFVVLFFSGKTTKDWRNNSDYGKRRKLFGYIPSIVDFRAKILSNAGPDRRNSFDGSIYHGALVTDEYEQTNQP